MATDLAKVRRFETLEEPFYVSSPLGIRARLGMICRVCELEISGTLLTVDLRIMDTSEFDVILGMDWLTAYRVVIDCERRRVTAYTQDGTRVVFQGDKHDILPQTVYDSKCQGQLAGVDPRFSSRASPLEWRDSLFVVLVENHFKKNGLESLLIFVLF